MSHTAINKHARKKDWQRDLTAKVRETVREKLIRGEADKGKVSTQVSTFHARTMDDEIVKVAAARGVEVVRQHQRSLGRAHAIVESMLGELEEVTKVRDGIAEVVLCDKASDAKRKKAMLKAVDLPTRAATAAALPGALKNLIPLERRAFNLDEPGEGVDAENTRGTKVVIVPAKDGDSTPVVKRINPNEAPA